MALAPLRWIVTVTRRAALARAVVAVACIVALAGCGGGEPVARVRDHNVRIVLDDFSIRPQTLRARAGRISFDIVNRGRAGHNFHLRRGPGEPLKVTTLLPGDTESVAADLRAGDYRMVCTVANHEELGMYGTLVLR
jgi:plastocyanin